VIRASIIAAVLLGACGTDAGPELVVRDAAMGAGVPTLLGADPGTVYWSLSTGSGPRQVAGSSLASLPAEGQQLGTASGPIAQAGDHVVFVTNGTVVRVGVATPPTKVATVTADALGESADPEPVLVWTEGAAVSWGNGDVMGSATLSRIVRCDHLRVTATSIYVAADGATERRLLRVDRKTGSVFPLTASNPHGASFPGGAAEGAVYRGRLVGADDAGALWLVEEIVAGATSPARAILVSVPEAGATSILLEHVSGASAFFTVADAFYWQERTALLTAPRSGGAAAIVGHLPGTAGAIDSGFVYFVDGNAIERLALDALD
jgi:hypothetical protein